LFVALTITFGAVPATAAVNHWLARTGLFGANFSATKSTATRDSESDTSEWIGMNATDTNKTLAALYPSYLTLPAAITKDDAIRSIIRLNTASVNSGDSRGSRVLEQTVGVHESYEFFANCAWYSDWLSADAADDSSRLSVDVDGLQTAAQFPALAAMSPEVTTRLIMFAKDAASGSRADVVEGSKELDCGDFLKGLGS
jgi:hypothetical protein